MSIWSRRPDRRLCARMLALASVALSPLAAACADDPAPGDGDLATTACSPTALCDLSAKPLTLAMVTAQRNRKSFQDLTTNEKKRLVTAILELKKYKNPWNISDWKTGAILSYYDVFVEWHADLYRCDGMKTGSMTMIDDGWDNDMGMGAHMNPLVMPWHREFLLLFENALRQVDTWPATTPATYISMPYWNWDATQVTGGPTPFTNDLMGPNGTVTSANHLVPSTATPFADTTKFPIVTLPLTANSASYGKVPMIPKAAGTQLARFFNSNSNASVTTLPTAAEVTQASTYGDAPSGVRNYDVYPWDDTVVKTNATATSFRGFADGWRNSPGGVCTYDYDNNQADDGSIALMLPRLTTCAPGATNCTPTTFAMHVQVHAWVGGSWGTFTSGHMNTHPSPNDPIFFMHHAFLDKIWNDWQQSAKKGGGSQWPTDAELNDKGANKAALYSKNHVMWPYRDPAYLRVAKDPSTTYPANQSVLKNRDARAVPGSTSYDAAVHAKYDTTLPGITANADAKTLLTASEQSGSGDTAVHGGVSVWDVLDNAKISLAHAKDGGADITTSVAYCAPKTQAGKDWPSCPLGAAVK